jgi:hypothetical protein
MEQLFACFYPFFCVVVFPQQPFTGMRGDAPFAIANTNLFVPISGLRDAHSSYAPTSTLSPQRLLLHA